MRGRNRQEEVVTRLIIGHTGLNQTLYNIAKHPTGVCDNCEVLDQYHVLLK